MSRPKPRPEARPPGTMQYSGPDEDAVRAVITRELGADAVVIWSATSTQTGRARRFLAGPSVFEALAHPASVPQRHSAAAPDRPRLGETTPERQPRPSDDDLDSIVVGSAPRPSGPTGAGLPVPGPANRFAAVLAAVEDESYGELDAVDAVPEWLRDLVPERDVHADVADVEPAPPAVVPSAPVRPTAAGIVATAATATQVAPSPVHVVCASERGRDALVAAGIPAELAPSGPLDAFTLTDMLSSSLPRARRLPSGRGKVIAVVGPRNAAVARARTLDPVSPVVAGPAPDQSNSGLVHLDDVAAVQDRATLWRNLGRTLVVVVPVDGAGSAARVQETLAALAPDAVRVALGASSRPQTARRICTMVEDPVLDLVGVTTSPTPIRLAWLGAPVATVDGRDASPALWAAILLGRCHG